MLDDTKNFCNVGVSTSYDQNATAIILNIGDGLKLPTPPFNAVWWNVTDYSDPSLDPNVEIVRVTNISSDIITIIRAQESTIASVKNLNDKNYRMIVGITSKTISDIGNFVQEATSDSDETAAFANNAFFVIRTDLLLLISTTTNFIGSIANILAAPFTSKTQPSIARIQQQTQQTQNGISRIALLTTKIQSAVSRLSLLTVKTITAISRITIGTTQTQSAISHIQFLTQKTQTAITHINSTIVQTTKTITSIARISILTQKFQTTVSRITILTLKTVSSVSRITILTQKAQLGKSRMTILTQKTQPSISRMTIQTARTQTAVSRMKILTTKTQSSIAHLSKIGQQRLQSAVANISTGGSSYSVILNILTGTPNGAITINGVAIESVSGYTTVGAPTGCKGKITLSSKTAIGATLSGGTGGGSYYNFDTNTDQWGMGGAAAFITNMASVPIYVPENTAWSNTGSIWAAASGGGGGDDSASDGGNNGDGFGTINGGSGGADGALSDGGNGGSAGMTSAGTPAVGADGAGSSDGSTGANGGSLTGASLTLATTETFFVGTVLEQIGSGGVDDATTGSIAITTTP